MNTSVSSEDEAVFVDCLQSAHDTSLAMEDPTGAAGAATPAALSRATRRASRALSAASTDIPTTAPATSTTTAAAGAVVAASIPSGAARRATRAQSAAPADPPTAAPATATATAATGAAGVASIPSGVTKRAPRVPPSHLPPDLPATAAEVTDLASLSKVVTLLSSIIVKAVHDGKSVTASNKRLIAVAAEETRKAVAAFQRLPTTPTSGPACTACASTPADDGAFNPTPQAPLLTAASQPAPGSLQSDLVQCVREEMTRLKSELITSVSNVVRPTYAQMLAIKTQPTTSATSASAPAIAKRTSEPTTTQNRPAIVVTPRGNVTSRQEAVAAWRSSISFKNSKYAPSRVKPVSNNKLRIEFETKDHRDDVLERLRNSEVVSAEPARGLQPMVILKGITKETPSEELCNIIREQNPSLGGPASGLKLRFVRKNRNDGLYNAVLLADPQIWRKIIDLGRVSVDHQKVHAENFSPFMQCFSCLQFGHGSRHCQQSSVKPCAYCAAATHREAECPTKAAKGSPKCYNCDSRNIKFDNHNPINHIATSQSCPVLRTMKARVEERINYGY